MSLQAMADLRGRGREGEEVAVQGLGGGEVGEVWNGLC